MTKAEIREVKKLEAEMDKQSKLNFSALMLVLYREYGYRSERLSNVLRESLNAFDECSEAQDEKSMIQMLEEETGIEIQSGDGKSWRDLPYLNNQAWDGVPFSAPKRIAMRQAQMKWIKPSVNAGILLAMHRLYGFGHDRCARLYQQMEEVLGDYNYEIKTVIEKCKEETGVSIVRYYEKGIQSKDKKLET